MNRSRLTAWVLMGSLLSASLCAQPIAAQVVPDTTLPVGARSQVTGNPTVQIDGGAKRGGNLFHSFSQFSIPTGGSAFFNNAADVQNIFSRVTGGSSSNIDGLMRANGTANLFLLNPNGILFGPNASLNIGGSFVATTANAIGFSNGEVFSSDAIQPLPSQLLTVNPNAFFFNQLTPKPIVVQSRFDQSRVDEIVFTNSSFNATGLHVPSGKNLLLIGGPIQLESGEPSIPASLGRPLIGFGYYGESEVQPDGGWLISPGSYVELGAVGGIGSVGLSTANFDWQLTIPNAVPRASISLSKDSGIYATGASGSIRMLAQNIDISKSVLRIGIPSNARLPNTQIGGIDLNATGSIALSLSDLGNYLTDQGTLGSINLTAGDRVSLDQTVVSNIVLSNGIGNAGDININTGSLFLNNRSGIRSYTYGQGNTGNVNINARDTVSLADGSFVDTVVNSTGIGNAGNINIDTGSLLLATADLGSSTSGRGNAGNVTINARDRVSLDGAPPTRARYGASTIFTRVFFGAVGQGGNVMINTGELSLTNGGAVNTTTQAQGNAGRVTIQARDVQISGAAPSYTNGSGKVLDFPSGVTTSAQAGSVGRGGDVIITTGSLSVSDQGRINTTAQGQGNAGDIRIQSNDAVSFNRGDAISRLEPGAVGKGGDIEIAARSLSVLNNAQLSASAAGNGNAGNITATADAVNVNSGGRLLTTTSSNGRAGNITVNTPSLQLSGASTGLFAGTTSSGDAGNLTIQPRGNGQTVRVNLQDGAQISASTSNSGRGGDLTIAAPESITLTGNGSVIAAGTGGSGDGGNLNLRTRNLNIQNQAEITVSSSGTGSAGNLFVDADRIYLYNQGSIQADTTGGGGNINLRSPLILLRNGSNITTNAIGANIPGGNIGIDTRFLIAVLREDSNISANSEDFRGGNVSIKAFSIYGIQPRPIATPLSDITATGATSALSGTIDIITAGLDPTSGLVALPTDLVDSSGLIAQGCPANQGNAFVITGRGGLPPTLEQQLDDNAEWSDRRRLTVVRQIGSKREARSQELKLLASQAQQRSMTLEGASINSERSSLAVHLRSSSQRASATQTSNLKPFPDTRHPTPVPPILEATGWQITPLGEVFLVATTPDPTVGNQLKQPVACQGRQ